MRIVAGKFKGRNLKSPPSLEVRPTSDRLRETLFNVIAPQIEGTRFLDLCAGSGAVGVEALSRGAAHVTFVDRARKMKALIESNLQLCNVSKDEGVVVQAEAVEFLNQATRKQSQTEVCARWDIVFFDPPYAGDYTAVLEKLGSSKLLSDEAILIVEHHHKKDLPDEVSELRRYRVLKQGDSALSFYNISR